MAASALANQRTQTDHATRLNLAFPLDGTEHMQGPLHLQHVTTAELPPAADREGGLLYDTTLQTIVWSNGVAWLPASVTPSAFFAYNSAAILNVTGDNTDYSIIFNTILYDLLGEFNTTTGKFTTVTTGTYDFGGIVFLDGLLAGHTAVRVRLVTSNRTFLLQFQNPAPLLIGGMLSLNWNCPGVDMDAGDTAEVQVTVYFGTKVVDIFESGSPTNQLTYFSGKRVR